ncbi:MAG: DUF6458 family protein [Acidimicrobiales bacterium]
MSVFLIAVGAILAFAVNVTASGVDLTAVGYILMVVGTIGLVVALAVLNSWGVGGPRTTVVDDGYADPGVRRVVRRRTYVD